MKLSTKTCLLEMMYLMAGISPIYSTGTEHKVNVGKSGSTFDPSHISAKKGDTITFVFFQE
jgi:plastocyanin